jgi:glycosyltransferase involved in cell wall biosynthesis
MNILFVCENYIPHYGGAEVLFKNLAERYVARGHSVSLVTQRLKGTKTHEEINGVRVYRVPSFHSRYLFSFSSILKVIKEARKSDIIQTTTFNGAFPAWLAGKLTGKKVVLTVHEVWAGKWKEVTGFPWWKCLVHELLERCIYILAFDTYICVSHATKNDVLKRGIKEENVETIYNGFDYELWNPDRFTARKMLPGNYVFFSWGRPGTSKGFEYVIQAMEFVQKNVPHAVLVLMFGSAERYKKKYKKLKQLIRKKKLEQCVKIMKSVPYEELGNVVKGIDCVVVPSVAEGFGYNAIEATAMGKPVIVSNAGSLPEVVSGEHLIFESKNVKDLAAKMISVVQGEMITTPVKKFEWESTINKYLKIYEFFSKK